MYLCFLLLSMTLFMCHFVPTNDVVKTVCLSASASSFFHLSTCFFLPFTFTKKSDCDNIKLVLSVIIIITILVKLMI